MTSPISPDALSHRTTLSHSDFAEARNLCLLQDFPAALNTLASGLAPTEDRSAILIEIARVYLIQGDRRNALKTLAEGIAASEYQDLCTILAAFMNVGLKGDLENGLGTAVMLWHKHDPLLTSGEIDEIQSRILYYCIEIFELWDLYGEGHQNSNIQYSPVVGIVTRGLLRSSLYFEAFELMQFMSQSPERSIGAFRATLSGSQDIPALSECILRLARVQAENEDMDQSQQTLDSLDHITELTFPAQMVRRQIKLRFLETELSCVERINFLMEIARKLSGDKFFDKALKCYEDAAEVHCQLPASPLAYELGISLHDEEKILCEQIGDMLSLLEFEFRRCDMISSQTGRLFEARKIRNQLLHHPISSKLPFFEKHHQRQYFGYSMLFQRGEALYHAESYLQFCKKYKGQEEISYANALRLAALSRPSRISDEARAILLEDIREQLEEDMIMDRVHGINLALLRKLALRINIERELHELQQSELNEFVIAVSEMLDEADAIGGNTEIPIQDIWLRYEIGRLRCEFETDFGLEPTPHTPAEPSGGIEDFSHRLRFVTHDHATKYSRTSFMYSQYMYNLVLVMRSDSQMRLLDFIEAFKGEEERLSGEGHSLEKAEFAVFRGFLYYSLSQYAKTVSFDVWQVCGLKSDKEGLQNALTSFDLALRYDDVHWKEASETDDTIDMLSARQSYITRSTEYLVFNTALTICHQLGDLEQTWHWIQKSKAQGFCSMLLDKFTRSGVQVDDYSRTATIEGMLWASAASVQRVIFVDWAQYGDSYDQIMLFALWFEKNSDEYDKKMVQFDVDLSTTEVQQHKQRLNSANLNSSSSARVLQKFEPLVKCLREICSMNDVIVLCPTGPLHNVPLHAIEIDGRPLIDRNPVVYTPSLSVLLACLRRLEGRASDESYKINKIAIAGAYEHNIADTRVQAERKKIYDSLNELASCFSAGEALVGTDLTLTSITSRAASAELFHFHGHGYFSEHDITSQALELGSRNETLSLRDISNLELDRAHATVLACEGALQDYSLGGNEPLGLISAFFLGGATSVLGVLWPIPSTTGRRFSETFYRCLSRPDIGRSGPISQLAVALQDTCKELRSNSATKRPYHWAGFVLYGVCTWLLSFTSKQESSVV